MNKDKKYPIEVLNRKTKEELIEIVGDLQEEILMLDFLLEEYEASQESLGTLLKEQIAEHMKSTPLSNIKTGEA